MKKLIFITLFIVGCSSGQEKTSRIDKELAKQYILKYINANTEFDENNYLDEITIIKFDTLTEKDVLTIKYNGIAIEWQHQLDITQNEQDILNSYEGLKFDNYIIEHQKRKVKSALATAQISGKKLNEIEILIPVSDSTYFKYYITTIKMDYTEKAMAKSNELQIYLNSNMQVVNWSDL